MTSPCSLLSFSLLFFSLLFFSRRGTSQIPAPVARSLLIALIVRALAEVEDVDSCSGSSLDVDLDYSLVLRFSLTVSELPLCLGFFSESESVAEDCFDICFFIFLKFFLGGHLQL